MADDIYNPWRESLENCIEGDNYLRGSEYRDLIAALDRGYAAIDALARKDAEIALLNGAMRADEERLLQAGQRVGIIAGCDTPEQLADAIEHRDAEIAHEEQRIKDLMDAISAADKEIAELRAEIEEEVAIRERMATLLAGAIVAIRGPEPELTRWGYHDLPERCAELVARAERAEARVREAPVGSVECNDAKGAWLITHGDAGLEPGKRVALVALEE